MNPTEEIKSLWHEFLEQPFPHNSRTKHLTGDLALLDGDVAGCVQTFVESETLPGEHQEVLRRCIGGLLELRARCGADDAAQKAYIAQLLALAKQVLEVANP